VAIRSADPNTDWSQFNVDALRDHLVDMYLVTLYAKVQSEMLDNGMRYQVTGQGDTVGAIKRMVTAHAIQVSNDSEWQAQTSEHADGVVLTVTSSAPSDAAKIRGLRFSVITPKVKFIHEGQYVAEVVVDVAESDQGWSPTICLEDAYKLDDVRNALKACDLKAASQYGRV
jgi:hypothetical protein